MFVRIFHRNSKAGYSIYKVFSNISGELVAHDEIEVPKYRAMPYDVLYNIRYVFLRRIKRGVNHISGEVHYVVLGFLGCKSVVTIHDLSLVDLNHGMKRFLKGWFWYKIPVVLATRIVCISNYTKERLIAYTGCCPQKVDVIYNAVGMEFQYCYKEFNTQNPRVLHIGTRSNKNLPRVIEALSGLRCRLIIVGLVSENDVALLKRYNIIFEEKNNLTDKQVLDEYIMSDIVSFPSVYEGFGMPIVEGQSVGRVVITSNYPPMTEVAGDGAVFVDPYSVGSIRDAFCRVIMDESYRESVIQKGRRNALRFSPSKIAMSYNALYNSLVNE